MHNILVCDDDRDIVAALKIYLSGGEYRVFEAYNGAEAVEAVRKNDIHLVLMDIMMPGLDGIAATAAIRRESNAPIILLTAKSESSDKVLGLNVGADDYITKPFSMRELMARVKANIRRRDLDYGVRPKGELLQAGNLSIDPASFTVTKNGAPVELTQKEFDLLLYLIRERGRVFTREDLMQKVWNYDYFGDMRTVDVTVRRLREKIEDDPGKPALILTKRGVGYYFAQ